ncbi:hypothetical protein AM587_10003741 [Phytophthora nicotianae]|uniref:Uncharacterized protein n=1 Tax=Phytophthora nicotianae TaxID=4792 RepID=A0A0W8C8W4_PHYNI|nr:hypothetical protein AM587_10003741 [Phytophthora nicotianae]
MDTSALREFAFKKLQEARERGSELAAVTAARAASSISSSVPVSSSFVFRAQSSVEQQQEQLPASLENKLETLTFSIENIQEGSHVMKLLNRQLKDSATMQNPAHKAFYQRNEQSAQ